MSDTCEGFIRALSALLLAAAVQPVGALAQQADQPLLQRSLFSDRKAHGEGDVLTVLITEVAAASATARTRTDKDDSVSGSIRQSDKAPWDLNVEFGNEFSGGGEIQRTGKLLGKLTVVVQSADANGNLTIYGEQDINVNNEAQRIALSGIVRPEDIGPDNTVPSWRISAAKIDFKGNGILARKQSPGLMSKLFDLFGLN